MKLLIQPAEAADSAFAAYDQIDPSAITEHSIEAAQLKFLKPVFGEMYDQMCEGEHADFVEEYVKPALAYLVKYASITSIAVNTGTGGVTRGRNANAGTASKTEISALKSETKETAQALLKKAVEHVEKNREMFPGYNPRRNVNKRIMLKGGLIL